MFNTFNKDTENLILCKEKSETSVLLVGKSNNSILLIEKSVLVPKLMKLNVLHGEMR